MTQGKSDLSAKVLDLADIIGYQDGSVVSRTIAEKGAGTITVFAFDEGEGLSEHTAPFDAVLQVVDGEARITISGNDYDVAAGQMIIMPANEPHSVRAVKKFKMLLVMLRA
jgi:quercetin dioxygenase-like cupin family protein